MDEASELPVPYRVKVFGLLFGLVLFVAVLVMPRPEGLGREAQRVAAVAVLMGIWWVTEAVPIAAASLAPLALFPLLGVMTGGETAACYGDSTIFLFAGGFFIAMAMQQWRLHERLALHVIRFTGTDPRRLVLGFMISSAFISLWISNAATTMMMLPIGLAVIHQLEKQHDAPWVASFGTAVMLGIAYASSIGGVGTIVGTAPNMLFVGLMGKIFPEAPRITFDRWLFFGMPLVIAFIPTAWFVMVHIVFRLPKVKEDAAIGRAIIYERLALLGPVTRGEVTVGIVFILTALAWIFRQDIPLGAFTVPGWNNLFPNPKAIEDGTVAIIGALILFMCPIDLKKGKFALEWEWARQIPWGILLLFGGGLAIAKGFDSTGLVNWAGGKLTVIRGVHPLVMALVIAAVITALTEFMSNTALTALMVPILAVSATQALHVNPLFVLIPATLSASLGFMMPAGTPPNALVFGSGYITIAQMMRTGFLLNVIGVVLVTLLAYFVVVPLFHISLSEMPAWAK